MNELFRPGQVWKDTDGNPIRSNGGGMLYHDETYYWFGDMRIKFIEFPGFSCYSSKDLLNWKNEGIALYPTCIDINHELHKSKIIERPAVIYNEMTKKFVMWMHVESSKYDLAKAGVAISDSPTGPYHYIESFSPNGAMSRDMTVYKDNDGKAYLIHSTEWNTITQINLLSDDYLTMEGSFKRMYIDDRREGYAVLKNNGSYYMIASGCTGFGSNPCQYAVSNSMLGEWNIKGEICEGTGSGITYHLQPSFAIPVAGYPGNFILGADRWRGRKLYDSRHVWLPIHIEGDKLWIECLDQWNFSVSVKGEYKEVPEGSPIDFMYNDDENLEIDFEPTLILKVRNNPMALGALLWGFWNEKDLTLKVLVYQNELKPVYISIWLNELQFITGVDEEENSVVNLGCGFYKGDWNHVTGYRNEHMLEKVDILKESNISSRYAGQLGIEEEYKGSLYTVKITNCPPLKPFKNKSEIAFAINIQDQPKMQMQYCSNSLLYSPDDYEFAYVDIFHKLIYKK